MDGPAKSSFFNNMSEIVQYLNFRTGKLINESGDSFSFYHLSQSEKEAIILTRMMSKIQNSSDQCPISSINLNSTISSINSDSKNNNSPSKKNQNDNSKSDISSTSSPIKFSYKGITLDILLERLTDLVNEKRKSNQALKSATQSQIQQLFELQTACSSAPVSTSEEASNLNTASVYNQKYSKLLERIQQTEIELKSLELDNTTIRQILIQPRKINNNPPSEDNVTKSPKRYNIQIPETLTEQQNSINRKNSEVERLKFNNHLLEMQIESIERRINSLHMSKNKAYLTLAERALLNQTHKKPIQNKVLNNRKRNGNDNKNRISPNPQGNNNNDQNVNSNQLQNNGNEKDYPELIEEEEYDEDDDDEFNYPNPNESKPNSNKDPESNQNENNNPNSNTNINKNLDSNEDENNNPNSNINKNPNSFSQDNENHSNFNQNTISHSNYSNPNSNEDYNHLNSTEDQNDSNPYENESKSNSNKNNLNQNEDQNYSNSNENKVNNKVKSNTNNTINNSDDNSSSDNPTENDFNNPNSNQNNESNSTNTTEVKPNIKPNQKVNTNENSQNNDENNKLNNNKPIENDDQDIVNNTNNQANLNHQNNKNQPNSSTDSDNENQPINDNKDDNTPNDDGNSENQPIDGENDDNKPNKGKNKSINDKKDDNTPIDSENKPVKGENRLNDHGDNTFTDNDKNKVINPHKPQNGHSLKSPRHNRPLLPLTNSNNENNDHEDDSSSDSEYEFTSYIIGDGLGDKNSNIVKFNRKITNHNTTQYKKPRAPTKILNKHENQSSSKNAPILTTQQAGQEVVEMIQRFHNMLHQKDQD